jgi:hypothetical protein
MCRSPVKMRSVIPAKAGIHWSRVLDSLTCNAADRVLDVDALQAIEHWLAGHMGKRHCPAEVRSFLVLAEFAFQFLLANGQCDIAPGLFQDTADLICRMAKSAGDSIREVHCDQNGIDVVHGRK